MMALKDLRDLFTRHPLPSPHPKPIHWNRLMASGFIFEFWKKKKKSLPQMKFKKSQEGIVI